MDIKKELINPVPFFSSQEKKGVITLVIVIFTSITQNFPFSLFKRKGVGDMSSFYQTL